MNSILLWTLISIQIAMGAFDTLYHHEFTERLAWRPSQGHELKLHAIRNFLYALIFIVLGWFEIYGVLAWALMVILGIEVVITLMDFVEEDMSRRLPATERINHTLLALNYGAILVLALPVLIGWGQQATGYASVNYGLRSYFALLSAAGVAIFGLRDLLASFRSDRLIENNGADLVDVFKQRQTILITGATGFIGRRLCEALAAAGHDVIALVRDKNKATELAVPIRIITNLDQIREHEKLSAIVNLAGAPIAARRWSDKNKRQFISSRVEMTGSVLSLVKRLKHKPEVLISGSAIGWYGLRGDEALTENDQYTDCFSHELCAAWEAAAHEISKTGVRTVILRIGIVLGTQGGALANMLTAFEFGGGGPMGQGQQWMSWIARDDLIRLIAYCISNPDMSGAVNATAPHPVRNKEFAKLLGQALRRPSFLPMPAFVLRWLLGEMGEELLLSGQKVISVKIEKHGFKFRYPELAAAFDAILGNDK